jgi:hypothetical protein
VFAIWVGLAALLAVGATMDSVRSLALAVLAVDTVLFAVLLVRAGVRSNRPQPEPAAV